MYFDHSDAGSISTRGVSVFTAQCTAIANHGSTLLALSIVGPGTSVDAIRAALSTGRVISHKSVVGQQSFSGEDEKFRSFKTRLSHIGQSHYILLNECLFSVLPDEYDNLFAMQPLNAPYPYASTLRRFLPLPILDEWMPVIDRMAMQDAYERVHKCQNYGCAVYHVRADRLDNWKKIIASAVKDGTLRFPEASNG